MRLQPESEHPHGLSDAEFDALFTTDKPIVFAYHGYPWLIHRLTYRRTNHANLHVRGYKEEGTTTTPFDMVMLNDLDRFHLVIDVIDRVPGLGPRAGARPPADGGQAHRGPRVHAGRGRGRPGDRELGLAVRHGDGGRRPAATADDRPDPGRQRGLLQPEAAGARPRRHGRRRSRPPRTARRHRCRASSRAPSGASARWMRWATGSCMAGRCSRDPSGSTPASCSGWRPSRTSRPCTSRSPSPPWQP